MATLNLDTAFPLDIVGVYEGNSFSFQLERYGEDETTPEWWPNASWELAISEHPSGTPKLMSVVPTIQEHLLTVSVTQAENLMQGGKTYYYDLVATFSGGATKVECRGIFQILNSIVK